MVAGAGEVKLTIVTVAGPACPAAVRSWQRQLRAGRVDTGSGANTAALAPPSPRPRTPDATPSWGRQS